MTEWWTYRPSDFLMFSARTWARLLEAVNDGAWPLQPLLLVLAATAIAAAWRAVAPRYVAALLAAAWAGVAWNFHWEQFAEVNTGARWFAQAWAVQAVLLLVLGTRHGGTLARPAWRRVGLVLSLLALVYPLLGVALGRGWRAAEVAGLMPDPTALLTVGLLLAGNLRHRGWLLPVPLLSLAAGWTANVLLYA